jgi:hypothetical protein
MTATVPAARTVIAEADVVTGQAVRARTWLDAGELANWCGGNGEVLVPAFAPNFAIAAGSAATWYFRVTPPGRAVRRTWHLWLSGNAVLEFKDTSSATQNYIIADSGTLLVYQEDLSAKSAALQTINFTLTNAASSATVTVLGVTCFEAPRITLDGDAADLGVELTTLQVREPIEARDYSSIVGVALALASPQRRQYFNIARPRTTADAWATTSGTFASILLEVPILARKVYRTDTTGNVRFAVYVSASDGTTSGEIRVTNNATTSTITIAATTPGTGWSWVTGDFAADILCEDLTQATGWPSGALLTSVSKTLTIDIRRSAGAGTFYVATVAAVEY